MPAGSSVFDNLHSRRHDDRVLLYAFDLLQLDGEDFRPFRCPHARRERALAEPPSFAMLNH
jgi:ATP-dependent DNA ligase